MAEAQNCTTEVCPSGPQTGEHILGTPEVCPEVVLKESLSFSTAPRSIWRGAQNPESGKCVPQGPSGGGPKRRAHFWVYPRSVLRGNETTPCVLATPEAHPCDTPKIGNPEKWSTPRSLLQVPENVLWAKTGRSPEDDLKPYCKNALGAKLQYPERLPRGRPEDTLVENGDSPKSTTPEISPSPLCATEGEA